MWSASWLLYDACACAYVRKRAVCRPRVNSAPCCRTLRPQECRVIRELSTCMMRAHTRKTSCVLGAMTPVKLSTRTRHPGETACEGRLLTMKDEPTPRGDSTRSSRLPLARSFTRLRTVSAGCVLWGPCGERLREAKRSGASQRPAQRHWPGLRE